MDIKTQVVTYDSLAEVVKIAKDDNYRILALSPSKIVRGRVTEFVLVVGK